MLPSAVFHHPSPQSFRPALLEPSLVPPKPRVPTPIPTPPNPHPVSLRALARPTVPRNLLKQG